ncbi:MAG: hypothetical protein R3A48_26700 [Polyangiales bacterium]
MRPLTALMVSSMLMLPPRPALAQAPPPHAPAAAALEARAQALYQSGREHFRAGRFDDARAAFLSSLERYDSPNTRMYLGRTLARLDRAAEAFSMLDRAARDAEERARSEPRYAATRDSARAEAEALRPSLAFLRVRVDPAPDDLTLSVNDGPPRRGAADVALPFAPGAVTVRAQAEGYEPAEARAELGRGESRELWLSLRAAAVVVAADAGARAVETPAVAPRAFTRRGPVRSLGVAVGVTGVTALAAGLALSLVAWDQYQTVRDDDSQRDLALEGIRNRDTANALFVVGGALGLTGLLMYLLAPRRVEAPSGASLSLGPSGIGVSGRF